MSQRRDNRSEAAREYRAWYKTATWKQIRREQLQTFPLCKFCEADGKITPATVCDHVNPHNGSWPLFVEGPFQSLCKRCHDKLKQIEERAAQTKVQTGLDGWPVDGGEVRRQPLKLGPISNPYWFRPVKIPLTIVCGAPASGKSTYVAERQTDRDVVIDLDAIAVRDFGRGLADLSTEDRIQCVKARNEMLGDLMRSECQSKFDRAWLIVSEPDALKRGWWFETVRPSQIVVLETPEAECLRRASIDREKRRPVEPIRTWWKKYTRREGDLIVSFDPQDRAAGPRPPTDRLLRSR